MAYRLTRDAEADLDEIWLRITAESGDPTIAQHLVESIAIRFDTLSTHPRMGRASHTQPQGCVEIVDLDVNPRSPYKPKRRARP